MTDKTKILLVEDDPNFGDVLRSYLEMNEYNVTLATDGEAGLKSYNKGLYRIQAILKRSMEDAESEESEFTIGKYNFNYPLRILSDGDQQSKLSPKESELLKLFCLHINNVLPRSKALKKIWGEDNYFTARSMDVFVTKLRKYLADDKNIQIVNIHGNGFQLKVGA